MVTRPNEFLYIILLLIQVIITLLIGIWAFRGYKLSHDKRLLNIYLGFTVIGGGIFVQLLLTLYTLVFRPQFFLIFGDYASAIAQFLGYLIIVIGYYKINEDQNMALQIAGLTLIFPLLIIHLASSILVMFILYKVILSYTIYREKKMIYSAVAFALLAFSYIGISISVGRPDYKIVSNILRLIGFLILSLSIYVRTDGER